MASNFDVEPFPNETTEEEKTEEEVDNSYEERVAGGLTAIDEEEE